MAEVKNAASADTPAAESRRNKGFELRLEKGGAFVRLADQPVAPGLDLDAVLLQVPDVKFPFPVGAGSAQFRQRLCDLVRLEISAEPTLAQAALERADLAALGLDGIEVAFRDGFAEIGGRVAGGPVFTALAGIIPDGEQGIAAVFHTPLLLGPAPLPAAAIPHLLVRALAAAGVPALLASPLPSVLRRVLPPRGWKSPRSEAARLAVAAFSGGRLRLAWDRGQAGPPEVAHHPALLAAAEGARSFREVEAKVARGEFVAARDAYLALGSAAADHAFAGERLLSLLCLDDRFHDEALDLAQSWLSRRPDFVAALAAVAWVRLARGEGPRASRAYADLATIAAARGQGLAALAAAEACFAVPGGDRAALSAAIEAALAVRRDHLPALRALRALASATGDREGHLRANRRLVTYAPDDAEKARAHAELGELLLAADPPAARLHLDQALRLAPDDPEALDALARACEAAGEPLRAVRARDRIREVLLARGDRTGAARSALEAGGLWEERLDHPENALLRFREACDLAPSPESHARAARAAEKLGQWAEAADHHAAALGALDLAAPGARELAARTHLALADVAQAKLGDPSGAAAHLEAALALAPGDAAALRRLAALHRALERHGDLLAALDRLAPVLESAPERAATLAEAGAVAMDGLARLEAAQARFAAALALDARCRPALEGLARLAAARGDAQAEREALSRLVPLATGGADVAAIHDQLARACERAGDLAAAGRALAAARRAAPSLPRLAEAVRIARLAGDAGALAALLSEHAAAARAAGDAGVAASAWLERARLLAASEPGLALAALGEARALSPGDAAVLRTQAELAERNGEAAIALGALRALLATDPSDAPALEVRAARAALAAGEPAAAREHAERAVRNRAAGAEEVLVEVMERSGDGAGRADLLLRLGRPLDAARLWEGAGDLVRARAAYEAAAADPSAAPEALARVADLRLADGDTAGTAEILLRLARLRGGRDGALLALRAHGIAPSAAALDTAVACDPGFGPVRAERAVQRAESDPRGALADAEAALSGEGLPPERRAAILRLAAQLANRLGDAAAARRHLEAYCTQVPGQDAELAELARLHREAGAEADLAVVLGRRLPLARGADAVAVRVELAEILATRGERTGEALRLLREALAEDPTAVAPLRALAAGPLAASLPSADREDLLVRLATHPETGPAEAAAVHAARARLLAEMGDASGALAAARAAAAGLEEDAALELRASVAALTGERAEAARALLARAERAAMRSDPDAAERLAEAGLAAADAGLDEEAASALAKASVPGAVDRDTARAVLEALGAISARRGDAESEREALVRLVPLLPAGRRPAALVRMAGLALAAGEVAAARAAADEAFSLAPRDPRAAEAARAAAEAQGDHAAVADRLADLAALEPGEAGPRQLARARLLSGLGRAAEADAAYAEALAALPPEHALAEEHARFRRDALRNHPAAEPLERFALRTADAQAAAGALREAAALALSQDDQGAALRCARRAYARTQETPAFVAPLLARILFLQGSVGEALVLHRALLESGFEGIDPVDEVTLCRQLGDLAEEAGDRDLALAALDRLLARKPQDADAAERRYLLDPDRERAVQALADAADATRSVRRKALALARAAAGALVEVGDRGRADRLFRRARADADRSPRVRAEVERIRASAMRAADGPEAESFAAAVRDAAEAAARDGDLPAAHAFFQTSADVARKAGRWGEAARDLLRLEWLAAASGDVPAAASLAREAAGLLLDADEVALAVETLHRSEEMDPGGDQALPILERLAHADPAVGGPLLADALAARVERAEPGPARAAAFVRIADALAAAGQRDRAIELASRALAEDPTSGAADALLDGLLAACGRSVERGRLLFERARRIEDRDVRAATLREAADLLAASPEAADRVLAADAFSAVTARVPSDLEAARAAADLLLGLGRREEAIPHLAALVRAHPDDEAAAGHLAEAYAGRHRERADLFLARAEHATGQLRAARLREAAKALFAAGEDRRAREILREAFEAWPADDAAFLAAIRDAAVDIDRLDTVLATRAHAVPAEAPGCHRARADALLAFGQLHRAVEAYQTCVELDPDEPGALAALADCLAESRGETAAAEVDGRLCEHVALHPGSVPGPVEARSRYRLGLAAWAEGRPAEGIEHLERALLLVPEDNRAGLAWAALAHGHAVRGDGAAALAAARSRADRAEKLGLAEERRVALEAGAELAAQFVDSGPDAAAILDMLLELQAADGTPASELAPLANRASAAFRAGGDAHRAEKALARAGLGLPSSQPLTPAPEPSPEESTEALNAILDQGPAQPRWKEAAEMLARRYAGSDQHWLAAQVEARRADAAETPAEAAAAWLASAEALSRAGGDPEEIRAALDLAADADPDDQGSWRARAALEARLGDRLAAARAHLSASIRAEGDEAARAALEAARLFEEEGHHADAARAYRAAIHARPGCVPARRVLAEEAFAAGDASSAADHLAAVPLDELPSEARREHERTLARALEAAGRDGEAEAAWTAIFRTEPRDPEAFRHLGALALARGGLDAWLDLAAEHDAALAAWGDGERRRDLRHERGRLFAERGRLEAARGAFLAALELDPTHGPTLEALSALDARHDEWRAAADAIAHEVSTATDGAEAAALLLRRARILDERLADRDGAAAALEEALVRTRVSDAPAARRVAREAEALLVEMGVARPDAGSAPEAEPAPAAPDDPVAAALRSQAEAASGAERAEILERLAGHLERGGDGSGAADALLEALEADPARDLTWSWLLALAEGDPDRLARARALRASAGLPDLEIAPRPGLRAREDLSTAPAMGEPWVADIAQSVAAELDIGDQFSFESDAVEEAALEESPSPSPTSTPTSTPIEIDSPPEPFSFDAAAAAEPLPEVPPLDLENLEQQAETFSFDAVAEPSVAEAAADTVQAARDAIGANPAAPPPEQARLWRDLARALQDSGDLEGATSALLNAQAADPLDVTTVEWLVALAEHSGREIEAIGLRERAVELSPEGPARAAAFAALGDRAEAAGAKDRAVWLYERARAADPHHIDSLAALARLHAERRDHRALRPIAAALEQAAGPEALLPLSAALGRAHLEEGEDEAAYARLEAALALDPSDLTVARDLSRAAERVGNWGEYVRLGEVCADAIAPHDPGAAAARYRHFAEVLKERLADPERAAAMLEKAIALDPRDPAAHRALLEQWATRPETAPRALDGWLAIARETPWDGEALAAAGSISLALAVETEPEAAARLVERGRLATSLAAFASPACATAPTVLLATAVPAELRERVAAPGATGPAARLLALLCRWLEPLFPADLARRGATPKDRLVAARAPELLDALERASRSLGGRPHASFLVDRPVVEMALENTQPPAIVLTTAAEALPEGARHFLAARAVDLLSSGYALLGKFAPKDVGILLELACRFAGGNAPAMGLPAQRADAFLGVLERGVPPTVRDRAARLAANAAEELAALDSKMLVAALRRTANRVALLHAGDPGGALLALARLEKLEEPLDPAKALSIPDLRDLALFALSDPFLDLRLSMIG